MWTWISRVVRSLIGVIAIVIAFALFFYLASAREAPKQRSVAERLPVVRAVRAASKPVAQRWTGYGTARAMNASDVAAELGARVIGRPEGLEAGASVAAGDVLVRLDPMDFEQRLRSAERMAESFEAQLSGLEIEEARLEEQAALLGEELEVARREFVRAEDALERGAGNESQVDARLQAVKAAGRLLASVSSQLEVIPSRRAALEASLDSARADQRVAEENVARATVRAPFDGVVQSVGAEVGEWVRAGDVVARVVDLSRIEVPIRLPQNAGAAIGVGDTIRLRTEGSVSQSWPATVSRVAPEADSETRSVTVYAEVRQRADGGSADLLRPGQFVMGEVESSAALEALLVPRRSVNVDMVLVASPPGEGTPEPPAGTTRAMIVREATADVRRYLEGAHADIEPNETQWAVIDPAAPGELAVRAGDVVIISNLESLKPGDMIDVRLPGEDAESPAAEPAAATARGTDTDGEARP